MDNSLNNNMYICLVMTNLSKVFNEHLIDFLNDVISIFPQNTDLQTGRTFIIGIKKSDGQILVKSESGHFVVGLWSVPIFYLARYINKVTILTLK